MTFAPLRLAKIATLIAGLAALVLILLYSHDPGLDKVAVISRLTAWIGQFTPRLPLGSPQANSMATLLEGMLFLAIAVLFLENQSGRRWLWAAVVLFIGLVLLISESRGAWLAVGLAGLVWLALYFRWARWLAALLGLGGLALIFAVIITGDIQLLDRVPLINRTLAPLFIRPDRLDVYRGSLHLIQDMPFTGIGLGGQFAMVYSRFVLLIQVPFLTYSHNFFLETWLELGLVGFLSLVWLLAGLFWSGAAAARTGHDLLYESTWIGLLAMAFHGMTDARPFVDLWCWLPFFLLLGLNALLWLRKDQPADDIRVYTGPLTFTAFVLLLVVVAVPLNAAAWQANLGSLQQIRAELSPGLSADQRSGLFTSAKEEFQNSIAARSDQRTAHLRLGLILTQEMRFEEAVDHLEMAEEYDPGNPVTLKALGLAYTWGGYLELAKDKLQTVPGINDELNNWGWWWSQQDQPVLSRRAYQVSLLLNPDQPAVQQALDVLPASP